MISNVIDDDHIPLKILWYYSILRGHFDFIIIGGIDILP